MLKWSGTCLKHRHGKHSGSDIDRYSTEKTYITWLRSFRGFVHNKKPSQLTSEDIQDFLSSPAVDRKVPVSTQNQALNALIFVYRLCKRKGLIYNATLVKDAIKAAKEFIDKIK